MYLRRSRHLGDPDDPELLAHHRAALLRLAEADGITIPPEFIIQEVGSGETIAARPKFQQKVTEWETGQAAARVLYVTELERLSRGSLLEVGRVMEALRLAGVRVRTPARWYDLSAGDDEFFYALGAILGHRELQKYRERVELKRVEQVRQGLIRTGQPPFGYYWDRNIPGERGRLRPDPEKFPLLQLLCREVLTTSLYRLAQIYDIPCSVLHWTLRNPAIAGWPARRYRADLPARNTNRPRPRSEWVWPLQAGDYPAACTRAEWEQIQAVLDERYKLKGKTGYDENGWAKDVVQFGACPGPVRLGSRARVRYTYERSDDSGYRYYIEREAVHQAAYAALLTAFQSPETIAAAVETARSPPEACTGPTDTLTGELTRLREKLDLLNEERLDLADLEQQASNARVREKLRQEIRRAEAALQREQQAAAVPADLTALLPLLPALQAGFPAVWAVLTGPEKRALLNAVVARLPVVIEPTPGERAWRREVLAPVYQEWVPGGATV
jgi:DNA invertase Pin-like site-specific DNA recombinase